MELLNGRFAGLNCLNVCSNATTDMLNIPAYWP